MNKGVTDMLHTLSDLIERLSSPIGADLESDGWTDESAAGMRSRLEALRAQLELLGSLPPLSERPLNMVRALDHWGVHGGSLVEDLAILERNLRSAPE